MQTTCTYLGPDFDPRTWDYSKPVPYCGCRALAGKNYCAEHYGIVYNAGSALRKRHKDMRKKQSIEDTVQMIIDIAEELEIEGWTPEQGWEDLETA